MAMLGTTLVARGQSVPVYTMAGHDAPGTANGLSSYARFDQAQGLALDDAGNVYVADTGNGTIRKVTPSGYVSTLAGLAGNFGSANGMGSAARFFAPQGVAVDYIGTLYVADTANAVIRKVSPAGLVAPFAGSVTNYNGFDGTGANANFYQPEGLAVDTNRNVYVADAWNHTIRKITSFGDVTTFAGLAGNPGGVDGRGSKARFNRPSGIAVDSATNLFVTDSFNHTIRRITPDGSVATIAGLPGVWGGADGTNSAARFFLPRGIAILNATNLVVVDSGNQTLRKISQIGTNWVVTTVAGLAGMAGGAGGSGSDARFEFPAGLATDRSGYLYIADAGNNEIRTSRIVPPTLNYSVSMSGLAITWPVSASAFVLERAGKLLSGEAWVRQTNDIAISGDEFVLALDATNSAAFYRLHGP